MKIKPIDELWTEFLQDKSPTDIENTVAKVWFLSGYIIASIELCDAINTGKMANVSALVDKRRAEFEKLMEENVEQSECRDRRGEDND